MATIGTHVSVIKTMIKSLGDDSKYTSPFLYELLRVSRNFLMSRRLKNFNTISSENYQVACLPLSDATFFDCSCVPTGNDCIVKKSNCDIPPTITGRNSDNLKVYTMGGTVIQRVPPVRLKAKTQSKLQKPYYTIFDNRIYLFNSNLEILLVEGIFEDPTDLDGFCGCNDGDGGSGPCYNAEADSFPIDDDLVLSMYDDVVKRIGISKSFPADDLTNDMNANE